MSARGVEIQSPDAARRVQGPSTAAGGVSIEWWALVPDPSLVADQPTDPIRVVPAARNQDGSLALLYLPQGGAINLNTGHLKHGSDMRWFNPSTGTYSPAGKVAADAIRMQPPGDGDWVIVIGG